MDILFKTEELRRWCAIEKEAKKEFGAHSAKKLRARLKDIAAAGRVTDLVAGRPHPLKGDRLGQLALDLHGADRLVFEPANVPVPLTSDGATDWSHVTSVRVVFIGDYHD